MQNKALVWFKNDLRIQDNTSLRKATQGHESVIAVYCFDPRQFATDQFGFKKTEKFRAQFLIETIEDLKAQLANLRIPLYTFFGTPEKNIPELIAKHTITTLYSQHEWTPEESFCIARVVDKIPSTISWIKSYDQFLFHPDDIPMAIAQIPTVFSNFRKQCEKHSSIRPLVHPQPKAPSNYFDTQTVIPTLATLGLDSFETDVRSAFPFRGGATHAWRRIHNYLWETQKLSYYKKTRNGLVGTDYSSKFSSWLANGSISPRQLFYEIKKYEATVVKNESTYWLIFELIWRDFFKYISLKHRHKIFSPNGLSNKKPHSILHKDHVSAWIHGSTPYPFVNANMLELKHTGWMSNRGRQNVASYFAKELRLDWRIGAAYFESLLIDYDVHSNYGNWLYVAGLGNDPRDRTFNIALQAERYDATQKYRRLWLQTALF